MKKRTLGLLLALCMVLSLLPLSASAADIVQSGGCGNNVSFNLDSDGVLTISGFGPMYDYGEGLSGNRSPFQRYSYAGAIKSVVIMPGVTSIGSYAFETSTATSVLIPDTVMTIGEGAFKNCTGLTEAEIPDSVTEIGRYAFQRCGMKDVTIPGSVESIDEAFQECTMESVTISDGVKSLNSAFIGCSNLKSVTIPKSARFLYAAFQSCSSLESVTILEGPENLYSTFMYCKNLKHVSLPESVLVLDSVFQGCTSLTGVDLPEGLRTINETFRNCTSLTSITIPSTVTEMSKAFDNCTALTDVAMQDGMNSPLYYTFYNCASLANVTLPEGMPYIGEGSFGECKALTEITIPDSVWGIGPYAFKNCTSLRRVNGLEHLTITDPIFIGCTALEEVDVGALSGKSLFQGCTGLKKATIRGGSEVDSYDFYGCSALKEIRLPMSLQTVASNAFNGAAALTDVYYCGTAEDWDAVNIQEKGNTPLMNAAKHFEAHGLTEVPGKEADCLSDGVETYWKCDFCGKLFSDAAGKHEIEGPEAIPALGHDWGDWTVTTPATALAEGEETRMCSRCGETETRKIPKLTNPFVDVTEEAFYFEPVIWAVYHDPAITMGTDATHFSPDATCTRAQAVTFLWRAMDCPEPTTAENPFTDVSETDWYYKPVLWAAENGITSGVGGGRFDPNGVCNRSQIVTFLWRATKPHEAQSAGDTFSDVPATEWFAEPVAWAVEKGITYGIGNGKFGPFLDCTRGQIVTFLYRCMK